jgi:hypothetical protein
VTIGVPRFSVFVTGVFSTISASRARCSSVRPAPKRTTRSIRSSSPSFTNVASTCTAPSCQPLRSAYIFSVIDVHAASPASTYS